MRILLVEDNYADVRLLEEELRDVPTARDLTLTWSPTLADALDWLGGLDDGGRDVQVVLADLGLPDSDGGDTIRRLLQARPDVPVVALTGQDDDAAALAAVDAGAQDYIVKGTVAGPVLVRLLRHAIERHRLLAAQRRGLARRDALLDFSRLALGAANEEVLQQRVCRLLCELLPASAAGVFGVGVDGAVDPRARWQAPDEALLADAGARAAATVAAEPAAEDDGLRLTRVEVPGAGTRVVHEAIVAPVGAGVERLLTVALAGQGASFDDDDVTFVVALTSSLAEALRRRAAERSLHARVSELSLTVAQLPGILWTLDDRHQLRTCQGAALSDLGLDPTTLLGYGLEGLAGDAAVALHQLARAAFAGDTSTVVEQWRGRWWRTWCEPLRDLDGEITGVAGLSLDVTDEYRREAELAHRALHDPVTDLANRRLLDDRLAHARRLAQRQGTLVGVGVLDLDEFKQINDTLGHAAGDAVLIEIARRLERNLRDADLAARLGGDEFAVLLEDVGSLQDAAAVADRLLASIRRPIDIDGHEVTVTASLGLALATDESAAETLLRDADTAAYRAKHDGRNQFAVFAPDMHVDVHRDQELRAALATALERDELDLHFQPIIDLADGTIRGAEALLRWHHPTLGTVAPGDFIPVAEQTGAIVPIGLWVLEQACARLAVWQRERPGFNVAVNVSARQLRDPGFVEDVAHLLARHGIEPGSLCLELTENALVEVDTAVPVLRQLRELGACIAVDDFGTGYSSFTYLRRFTVDILKIDREFVAGVAHGPEEAAIVRAILQLASTLQLCVVAEGVEEAEQAALLRAWGCDVAQGWLWAPALTVADLEVTLEEGVGAPFRAPARLTAPR